MGNSNSKNPKSKQKFTGSLKLPIYWEEEAIYENPESTPERLSQLPESLLEQNSKSSKNGNSNVYWNGYGFSKNPVKDDFEREEWEMNGCTVAGGFSHSIAQKLEKNQSRIEEEKIAHSITKTPRGKNTQVPLLDMKKIGTEEKKSLNDELRKKLYEGMMPLIPEESFRFLKLDNPRLSSLRDKIERVEGIENLNSRALKGQKKRFSLNYQENTLNSARSSHNQNYPIKPLNTLDMELEDINELESYSGINFALHSAKPDINLKSFTKKVNDSLASYQSPVKKVKKSTNLKKTVGVSGNKNLKKKNNSNKTEGGEVKGTQKPDEMRDFRIKFNDIAEISSKAFQCEERIVNKGKIQIEIMIPDSNFYSPHFRKICPLPYDAEQTERGMNLEIHFGIEGQNSPQKNIEEIEENMKKTRFHIFLKEITQNECTLISKKIRREIQELWEIVKSNTTEDSPDLKVDIYFYFFRN